MSAQENGFFAPPSQPLAEEIAQMLGEVAKPSDRLVERLVALVEREKQKVHDFHDFLETTR